MCHDPNMHNCTFVKPSCPNPLVVASQFYNDLTSAFDKNYNPFTNTSSVAIHGDGGLCIIVIIYYTDSQTPKIKSTAHWNHYNTNINICLVKLTLHVLLP